MKYVTVLVMLGYQLGAGLTVENAELEGTWLLVRMETRGEPLPDALIHQLDCRMIVMNDRYHGTLSDGSRVEGSLHWDATKKPMECDFTDDSGPRKNMTRTCIYKFDGDHLIICASQPGERRPQEFHTEPSSNNVVAVYKRVR